MVNIDLKMEVANINDLVEYLFKMLYFKFPTSAETDFAVLFIYIKNRSLLVTVFVSRISLKINFH